MNLKWLLWRGVGLLVFVATIIAVPGFAQQTVSKKLIGNELNKEWPKLKSYGVSPNGTFVWYTVSDGVNDNLTIRSLVNGWIKNEMGITGNPSFIAKGNLIMYSKDKKIILLDLYSKEVIDSIEGERYILPEIGGNSKWIGYRKSSTWVIKKMFSNITKQFPGATTCFFNSKGTVALIQYPDSLFWFDLISQTILKISDKKTDNICFDRSGKQLVFLTGNKNKSVNYYRTGLEVAKVLVFNTSVELSEYSITGDLRFNDEGSHVFFIVDGIVTSTVKDSDVITGNLNLWSYKDRFTQAQQQLGEDGSRKRSTAAVSIDGSNLTILQGNSSGWQTGPYNRYFIGSDSRSDCSKSERYYPQWKNGTFYLKSIDGNLNQKLGQESNQFNLSPNERFVLWKDSATNDLICLNVATGKSHDLSKLISGTLYHHFWLSKNLNEYAWLKDDKFLLISDEFDVWQIDPTGTMSPICLTNHYGKEHGIKFKFILRAESFREFKSGNELMLSAFDTSNCNNGVWKVKLGEYRDPVEVIKMDRAIYCGLDGAGPVEKASDVNVYLLTKQSVNSPPNLYFIDDEGHQKQLTDLKPNQNYNWMTSELMTWQLPNGKIGRGILYKPENFDASMSYPVIFYYYQELSNELNLFRFPHLSDGSLNIPWYVSNGYLVFMPDVSYETGHPARSVIQTVTSAAKYLAGFSWVNKDKLGLQGHSFGGYETNVLVTGSNIFAAASSAAGLSNFASEYGTLRHHSGETLTEQMEAGQMRMATSPSEQPQLYLENSPIFRVNRVTTPILLMHNKEDFAVPFTQSMEFYVGLRRLNKPCWLLQYDGEDHGISDRKNQLDFTIRQEQFFDHYLRDKPAPIWMTEGIDFKEKGLKSGFGFSVKQ